MIVRSHSNRSCGWLADSLEDLVLGNTSNKEETQGH